MFKANSVTSEARKFIALLKLRYGKIEVPAKSLESVPDTKELLARASKSNLQGPHSDVFAQDE